MSFLEELKDKLKEVGWSVLLLVLKWLVERLSNPGEKGE